MPLQCFIPEGTAAAAKLNNPLKTIVKNDNHLLPHRSKTRVRKVSAGNSVADATVNVRNKSSPKDPTFLTCPSKTKDIAIQIRISKIVIFRR